MVVQTRLWNNPVRSLILASASLRRRDILTGMGLSFRVEVPQLADETGYFRGVSVDRALETLSQAKAQTVARSHLSELVLAADTVVVCDDNVLGKPQDREDAMQMIRCLSGRTHRVLTGVSLVCPALKFSRVAIAETQVMFRKLENNEIEQYLLKDDFGDKAGAYGIQGSAMVFVEQIRGCYYNVVGLPVATTIQLLTEYQSIEGAS